MAMRTAMAKPIGSEYPSATVPAITSTSRISSVA
jgi:hypothetical protein